MFRNRLLSLALVGLAVVVIAGCPQSSQQSVSTPGAGQVVPTEELKTQLESLAEMGEMFPGSETIADNIATVKAADAELVTLIKPQFEAGRREVAKGGVVRDAAVRRRVVDEIRAFGTTLGLHWEGVIESPLKGPAGNTEYLAYWH